jgi:hypothetical protein
VFLLGKCIPDCTLKLFRLYTIYQPTEPQMIPYDYPSSDVI